MVTLLPFHKSILEQIHDPQTSDLLVLARGLGLRHMLYTLMKIYNSPRNLVLLVNASQEEESVIGEEVGMMGVRRPGLRVVGHEIGKKDRGGGLMSVTSRILVVDMLQSDIPTDLITGILVLHAEKVTALSLEAFIVRLYRGKNTTGLVKAFTDQPEHITSGISPLKNIMKELQLRKVHIYPRFHEEVKASLERRRADVIELYQPLTDSMKDIHEAIVQCMTTTLAELKRSNATLDLDDLNVENAYFRSFDAIVCRELDPAWHKVGLKTKQLVADLATLRRLLTYLLTYDPLAFHAYLETIIASNSTSASGGPRQHQSPWLLTDAANIIFKVAKRRCYTHSSGSTLVKRKEASPVINLVDDDEEEDAWDALDEIEGRVGVKSDKAKGKERERKKPWVPDDMDPVLEELPKWSLLAEILKEIEEEMMRQESLGAARPAFHPGSNTVLIMTSSTTTSTHISEFLSTLDADAEQGTQGRTMMEKKLRLYLEWKAKLSRLKEEGQGAVVWPDKNGETFQKEQSGDGISEALKRKDQVMKEKGTCRRRVRGGAPAVGSASGDIIESNLNGTTLLDITSLDFENEFDAHYGLLAPEQTVIVRSYSDDSDDRVLAEIQPKYIVMFEPNQDFVRRIEVHRSSNPGLSVRVYFMVYQMSCEEHKYLAGIRREKESFERLIKERGSMLLPVMDERTAGASVGDAIIKTISSRIAGGRKELNKEPSRVIVDMREFWSTLPSLLHASRLLVIPATLTVGDYIITSDICIERKSIPDLIQSFNSGRLYTQCELMSVHYKQPVLLIEFEEHKSFSLNVTSYTKAGSKYPQTKSAGPSETERQSPTIQHKLVLLSLSFPRVRIIWQSLAIGAEEDPHAGAGVNAAAEKLLRSLPGITAKKVKHVMSKVRSVRELCEMSKEGVQEILGVEPGNACWEFMHRGEQRR
ncbi:hypothetical protein PILCRDRAFT_97161 [Piloderma croceum F 1598]|uniref:ERCC4 domain-containing protein n=1 Tax=Piloderma croceum (strain F 1598) TaxID=765440 RepID=A0A0C3BBR7_PILCF|nr:hypothetical protein PILCRDRAFT_97161 [Piloderma croceum F 1598]